MFYYFFSNGVKIKCTLLSSALGTFKKVLAEVYVKHKLHITASLYLIKNITYRDAEIQMFCQC